MNNLVSGLGSEFQYEQFEIRDYDEDVPLQDGITISPLGEEEQIGTNARDDIDYITLVTRKTHSLGKRRPRAKVHLQRSGQEDLSP